MGELREVKALRQMDWTGSYFNHLFIFENITAEDSDLGCSVFMLTEPLMSSSGTARLELLKM